MSQAAFMTYFWPLFTRLDQLADDEAPKPAYFRFLTLLGAVPHSCLLACCSTAA